MKKIIFFLLLLAFSRLGVAFGMGSTPVGIGNFFLGSPSITESNLNQVLGLLVGPAGAPGVAGVSGANGKDGLDGIPGIPGVDGVNGLNGVNGQDGAPGAQGIQGVAGPSGRDGTNGVQGPQGIQGIPGPAGPVGPAGPAGPAGAPGTGGSGGFVGVGGGTLALSTCDDNVTISVTQSFEGDHFNLSTVTVSGILGITTAGNGCAGHDVTIYAKVSSVTKQCTLTIPSDIAGTSNRVTFTTSSCSGALAGINMKTLDSNIGLEFTEHGAH